MQNFEIVTKTLGYNFEFRQTHHLQYLLNMIQGILTLPRNPKQQSNKQTGSYLKKLERLI